jgi:hypothetical protein
VSLSVILAGCGAQTRDRLLAPSGGAPSAGVGGIASSSAGGASGAVLPGSGGLLGAGAVASNGGTGGITPLGQTIAMDHTWVPREGNAVGIQGAFYILEDGVRDNVPLNDGMPHSDLWADTGAVEEAGHSLFGLDTLVPCVSGTIAQLKGKDGVTDCGFAVGDEECDLEAFWGGGIGLVLNDSGGETPVQGPFDALAAGIRGFRFVISGDVGGADVTFEASMADYSHLFCRDITVMVPGEVEVPLSDVVSECWFDGGFPVDATRLHSLRWKIAADNSSAHAVQNFCIESLEWF